MQPRRSFIRRARHSSLMLLAAILVASSAALANGPMGGGGENHHGGGPQDGGGVLMPNIPIGSGAPSPDSGPEGPGDWGPGYGNYPPADRPDRNQSLIDQIRQNGESARQRDEEKARRCESLRTLIANMADDRNGAGYLRGEAKRTQILIDRYLAMNPGQIDAEILFLKQMRDGSNQDWLVDEDDRQWRAAKYTEKIAFLKEMKQLRARYGSGYVYQNAIKGTDYYKTVAQLNEQAALERRDFEEPDLRDYRAEYAELGCAAFLAGQR